MTNALVLTDLPSVADLRVFLRRAARLEDGLVRMIASGTVLAVYVPVLYPSGLLDSSATVLGLRTFALEAPAHADTVLPIAEVLSALPHESEEDDDSASTTVVLPTAGSGAGSRPARPAGWAAVSPPRSGWVRAGATKAGVLQQAARAGIAEIAEAIPSGTGEQIVNTVRSEVWGRPLEPGSTVPTGAAFAGYSLGFLGDVAEAEVPVFESGRWQRLSSDRGHVLVKRRAAAPIG